MSLSNEIINVLEYLGRQIGITIDWTSENVLPYVEQLCEKFILWEVNTSFAWMGIMAVVVILSLIAAILVNRFGNWYGSEWFIFGCVVVIAVVVVGLQIFDIIECRAFPEKAIYDYIQFHLANK
jgi:hypothetical protein